MENSPRPFTPTSIATKPNTELEPNQDLPLAISFQPPIKHDTETSSISNKKKLPVDHPSSDVEDIQTVRLDTSDFAGRKGEVSEPPKNLTLNPYFSAQPNQAGDECETQIDEKALETEIAKKSSGFAKRAVSGIGGRVIPTTQGPRGGNKKREEDLEEEEEKVARPNPESAYASYGNALPPYNAGYGLVKKAYNYVGTNEEYAGNGENGSHAKIKELNPVLDLPPETPANLVPAFRSEVSSPVVTQAPVIPNQNNVQPANQVNAANNQNPPQEPQAPQVNINLMNFVEQITDATREQNIQIISSETKVRLRIFFVSFIFMFLLCTFIRLYVIDNQSLQSIFVVLYVFAGYIGFERLIRLKRPFQHEWHKREMLFNLADTVGLALLVLLINLKSTDQVKSISVVFIYPLVFSIVYIIFSKAPRGNKETQTIIRLLITVEILLLTKKIDGDLDWDWLWVISLFIVYLSVVSLYCLFLGATLCLMILFILFRINLYSNLSKVTQIIGIIWNFLVNGLGLVMLVALVGICQLTPEGSDLFLNCMKAAQFISIFLMSFTGMFFSTLTTFLAHFASEEARNGNHTARVGLKLPNLVRWTKVKTYFAMISSTYFVPLKESFVIKDRMQIKKIKSALQFFKAHKIVPSFYKSKMVKKTPQDIKAIFERLKLDKLAFDKKFRQPQQKPVTKLVKKEVGESCSHSAERFSLQRNQEIDSLILKGKGIKRKQKIWLSEGDEPGYFGVFDEANKDENNGLCYVCFTNEANSVMMECGHGGVCHECALEFLLRKNQCIECRRTVSKILKVKPDRKLKNIVIGEEIGQVR